MKTIFLKIVERGLDEIFFRSKSFQGYVHMRYSVPSDYVLVDTQYLAGVYHMYDGLKFHMNNMLHTLKEARTSYRLDNIKPSDTVLDIGACIGGFALQAAKRSKHVYAIEPLYADYLRDNITLNGIKNITVIDSIGLGNGRSTNIKFGARHKTITTHSLSDIIHSIGGCDVIKMDCEGAEWYIDPDELKGVRCIEGEIHSYDRNRNHSRELNDFKKILDAASFLYTYEIRGEHMIIHATSHTSAHHRC